MASYYVLRDCFCSDNRFYHAGSVVELPDSLEKSPKNFRAVNEAGVPIIPPEPVKATQQVPGPQKDEPVVVPEPTLDWDNAPEYVSDKDKATEKNKKK
jgi:hypothetical protein